MVPMLAMLLVLPLGDLAAQTRFSNAIPDLPLMEGLNEEPGAAVFDKPSGRIVEMTARGQVTRRAVEKFYDTTLPALGWQPVRSGIYQREAEQLALSFRSEDNVLLVRFVLSPLN